ncbi:MAG: oligoendopeptidase F [Bacillales bacterium]|nr:oligoendopeptidase F [Bacillales bacterium]
MKWDLTNYYKTYEDFKAAEKEAAVIIEALKDYKGKLDNEESFVEYFNKQNLLYSNYLKLYLYAECKVSLDRRDNKAVGDVQEVMFLFQKLSQNTSFEEPEILSIGSGKVFSFLDKHEELQQNRFALENLFRKASHVLNEEGESIIANYSALSDTGSETYASLTSGDVKECFAKLDNKEKVSVTQSNWTKLIAESNSPKERKRIFETMFGRFEENKNTFASIYNSVLQADIALAKSKNFDTALDMHLFANNIPVSLYHNLIEVAHKAAPTAKKYLKLRKQVLGLKSYHTYDRFLKLSEGENKKYTYDEAKELFFSSIAKFDPEFNAFAREATKDGYVDVYPALGKRSGAYSNSVPNVHPCILLNFTETLEDVFTLAHESGHSMHTLFSEKYQPAATQNYTIFVAEIASTFNEHNLLDYLLTKGTLSKNEKIKLIQNAIDNIMSTFYRQTLFAEYEYLSHTMAEKGEPITEESLSSIMIGLYKKYYGLDINKEKVKKYVWAYIPHFYNSPYYVYQYATSFSASLAIYENVKKGGSEAFEQYKSLLKAGGSDYPVLEVKKAGVDFTSLKPLMAVVDRFKELLDELEKAIAE